VSRQAVNVLCLALCSRMLRRPDASGLVFADSPSGGGLTEPPDASGRRIAQARSKFHEHPKCRMIYTRSVVLGRQRQQEFMRHTVRMFCQAVNQR
jgi:hypothetical protein